MKIKGRFGTNATMTECTYVPGTMWLFVRNSPRGNVKGVLHLDKDTARMLRSALDTYLEE